MKKNTLLFLIFCLLMMISGCESLSFTVWSRMRAVSYKDHARRFTAEVPVDWMRYNLAGYFLMTKDGVILNSIAVERYRFDKKLEYTKKQFTLDMTPQDLAEVEIDNFQADTNIHSFILISNQPALISGIKATKLEYSYLTQSGLKINGIHYSFIHDKRVVRVRYEAADQHYFGKYKGDFERFVNTFKVI